MHLARVISILVLLGPWRAWAQDDRVEEGIRLLEQGELEMAHQVLLQELGRAKQEEELEVRFYLGLTRQQQAETDVDDSLRRSHLAEAASWYEKALEIDNERGPVLNNLAQVYVDLDRPEQAERMFERAVAQVGPLQPFFHRNYGDFLVRRGNWKRAADHYRQTLDEEPDDLQAHTSLVKILSQDLPELLPEYLWFLIGKGQMLWAEEEALKRLVASSVPPEQEKEYLTILVGASAARSYLPQEFLTGHAADVLRSLSDRPDIGEGAREVLRLHEGQDFDLASYRWWAEQGKASGIFVGEPTPRQTFRHLLRSLGEAEQKAERYDVARRYFRLSILLTPAEPDLAAFRMLVNLPSSSEDVAMIDQMAEWNEGLLRPKPSNVLFIETAGWKQALSRQANTATQADLYLYRHDLGLLYSFFRRWDGKGPASGIYQLSQATQMGGIGPPDGPPDTPTFDARIYTRLALGYAETGKPEQARQTLYDLMAAYRSHGLGDEADALQGVLLKSGQGGRHPPNRRREVFDDPPLRLQDFTTEPPSRSPL
jgi:tetratricopeptide (TPR) repeat protein